MTQTLFAMFTEVTKYDIVKFREYPKTRIWRENSKTTNEWGWGGGVKRNGG